MLYSVKKDYISGDEKEGRKLHFDVKHLNFIVWKNEKELEEKLIKRIKKTIK